MNQQPIFDLLLSSISSGSVCSVNIGANWTAVVVEIDGITHCGLASSMESDSPTVLKRWEERSRSGQNMLDARQLACLVKSAVPYEVSIGMAAINALLPPRQDLWQDINADEVIAELGARKNIALIGHFPFVSRLAPRVKKLWVLEINPGKGDLPASAAPAIIPQADILAITAMTLMNATFDELMALRNKETLTMLIGPSTPLSPILFDHGISILSGAAVQNIDNAVQSVMQGANFRQLHHHGVKLVTMLKPGLMIAP